MKYKKSVANVVFYICMLLISLTMIFPFIWMFSTSFKISSQIFTTPIKWIPNPVTFSNYIKVWTEEPFLKYYINTAIVTVCATVGQVILCAMAAYAFAKLEFIGKNFLFACYLATMMVPWHTIMIPQYQLISKMGLRQFFMSVPNELREAAKIDGANEARTFLKIIMPQAKPGITTLIIFTFIQVWNDYLAPLIYINSRDKFTIQLGLKFFQTEHTMQYGVVMAGNVCALLPLLIVYLFFEKQITNGMVHSGLKG